MAFVPGFENDLFISYAQVDNSELIPGRPESRWVTSLRNSVQILVDQKLGGSGQAKIWRDTNELHGNELVTPDIQVAIQSTAVLVVIMSSAVLERPWCNQERELFVEKNASLGLDGRIFLIHKDEVPRERWPREFQDLIGYPFFTRDTETGQTETLGVPVPDPTDKDYFRQLERLRSDIAGQLKSMRSAAEQPRVAAAVSVTIESDSNGTRPAAEAIFVSEVSPALEDERDGVVQYLQGEGFNVLPDRFYSRAIDEYRDEASQDIARCKLFVQLLGESATRASADTTYEGIQFEIASEHFKDSRHVLLWRSPLVDVTKAKVADHQHLLTATSVVTEDLEEFKPRIIQAITRSEMRTIEPQGDRYVLIHTGDEDLDSADELADRIRAIAEREFPGFEFGYDIVTDSDLLSLVSDGNDYDGLMILYGKTPQTWANKQVRGLRTVMLKHRNHPPKCAVLLGPTHPEPLRCRPPRVWFVEWNDEQQLRSFLDTLTTSEAVS